MPGDRRTTKTARNTHKNKKKTTNNNKNTLWAPFLTQVCQFGINLGSILGSFGVNFGSILGPLGVPWVSLGLGCPYLVVLGPPWTFWVNLGSF